MAGLLDFEIYEDDFVGTSVTLPASANIGTPWLIVDTSSSGTPTYVRAGSAATLTLAATSEVENVCLAHGDSLAFDIDDIQRVEMRVKLGAAFTTGSVSWCSVWVRPATTRPIALQLTRGSRWSVPTAPVPFMLRPTTAPRTTTTRPQARRWRPRTRNL
jgi:hypothetical protein